MKKTLLFDFSKTILFPKNTKYNGSLNSLHQENKDKKDYKFWDFFYVNEDLLFYLAKNAQIFNCHIFTTGRIQETPEVQTIIPKVFHHIYTVADIKIKKDDPKSYLYISKKLNLSPQEITFIDDSEKNIKAAKKAKFDVIHFANNQDLITNLEIIKIYITLFAEYKKLLEYQKVHPKEKKEINVIKLKIKEHLEKLIPDYPNQEAKALTSLITKETKK